MPGSPPQSPNFGAPRWSDADDATFAVQVNGVTDIFDGLAVREDDPRLVDQRTPADGSVTTAKLAAAAVTGAKIAAQTITEGNLAAGSVGSPEIIDRSIANTDLADNSVDARVIAPAGVIAASLGDGVVILQKLAQAIQNALCQPGDLIPSAAPSRVGCVLCDGAAYSRTDPTYAALFAAVGTTYGAGDGSTTFNVPDYRGRTFVAAGQGAGLTNRALGVRFGEEAHSLSVAEIAAHAHGVTDPTHAHSIADPGHNHGISDPGHAHAGQSGWNIVGGGSGTQAVNIYPTSISPGHTPAILSNAAGNIVTDARATGIGVAAHGTSIGIYGAATGVSVQSAGSGAGHNNMQPSVGVNVFIKL